MLLKIGIVIMQDACKRVHMFQTFSNNSTNRNAPLADYYKIARKPQNNYVKLIVIVYIFYIREINLIVRGTSKP